jgi:hypothetical protein
LVNFKGEGMKCRSNHVAAGLLLAALSGFAYADDTTANSQLPTAAASFYTGDSPTLKDQSFGARPSNPRGYLIAANDGAAPAAAGVAAETPAEEFHPSWLTGRKAHQYLGLGTVILAGLTALAAPEEGCEQNCPPVTAPRQTSGTTHTRLARATGAMAIATVATGLIYHWDDFHFSDGLADPDNQHVLLAGTGALMMLYAIDKSMHSSVPTSHAGIAEAGAVAMLVAIKLTW